jgi:hypothetical protein
MVGYELLVLRHNKYHQRQEVRRGMLFADGMGMGLAILKWL